MFGRIALLLAAGVLVSACGGGGGGDGGGGGGVQDAYSLSTSSVTFSANQGGTAPAPQTVSVTVNRGTVFIATTQSGSGFSHSFVITGQTTGQIIITPDPPSTPGNFSGTITVRGCASSICSGNDVPGSPKTINVTYTVAGGPALTVAPTTVDFVTTPNNVPASQNVTLSLSSGSLPWSAMVVHTGGTAGWLTVTPMSGTVGASEVVTFSVNSAPLAPEVRTATVTFTAGSLTRTVPVSLTINSLGVNFVSPYVATTPVAGANVIIRGYGFTGVTSVAFGVTPATTFTFVSDTEIRATLPALVTGTHAVNVTTGAPLTTRANLVVVNPPAFGAANIARPAGAGNAANLIYDAERQALFLMDPANNRIERYRFTGSWVADTPFMVGVGGGNPRIALSPDGTELLKTSGNGTALWRINPATIPLALMSSPTNVDASSLLGTGANLNLIAFANDGRAVGSSFAPSTGITLYRYDMLNRTFTASSTQADMTNRTIVASGDGDTLVLPTFEPLAPGFFKPVVTYDASAGALTSHAAILTSQTEHASVSRNGSRMILVSSELSASQVTTVYSFDGSTFTALGNLPAGLTGFVISPDGSTAFAYFPSTGLIQKFDLNTAGFPQTNSVAVPSPGTFFNAMTISPDGGTLFLAGNQQLIIVPAP